MDTPLTPPDTPPDNGYILPPKQNPPQPAGSDDAAALIRQKLQQIYADEPDAKQELAEAEAARPKSKHQQFMHALSTSGKNLAQIQTEWHNYYVGLPDAEKHEVWQEFYASNSAASHYAQFVHTPAPQPPAQRLAAHKHEAAEGKQAKQGRQGRPQREPAAIRGLIRDKVSAGGKLQTKHHLQSLLFGIGMGLLVVFIFLFGFFNEVFLAPFIQPSRHAATTPFIINQSTVAPTNDPEVIIPKINVEIPVDYSQTSTDEKAIESALNSGVVHYPSTSLPGQNGNAAFFGHSSNNIFNPGKYKFAFVLLHELVPGDTFYLTKDGQVYVYKVFKKTVVNPDEVWVLDPVEGHKATATLITCDPPGTSLKRLIIFADQVSPDPAGNTKAQTPAGNGDLAASLPGNGPTLWGRWWGTAYGKTVTLLTVAVLGIWAAAAASRRTTNRPA